MLPLIILLICLLLIQILVWFVLYKDLLAPPVLINISFIGAILLLLKGAERLQIKNFSPETSIILLIGILSFITGGIFCALLRRNRPRAYSGLRNPHPFFISEYVYALFALFTAVVAYVQYKYEVSYLGFAGTFTEIVSAFRDEAVLEGIPAHPFVAIFGRIIYALQPIVIFIIFYNRVVCGKKINNLLIFVSSIVVYFISIFILAGSRGKIFTIIFQVLFTISICYNFLHWRTKEVNNFSFLPGNKVWLKSVLIIFFIGIPLFYYVGVLQGKKYSEMTTFEPVENYFSYGLIHLDHTVVAGTYESENFGQWSFPGYYSLLNKLGAKYPLYDSLPFYGRYGNTITFFGRWYQDFDILGVIIMAFLYGFFFSWLYYRMIYADNDYEVIKNSILYVFFMPYVLMASYDDWVKGIPSLNGFYQIFILLFTLYIFKYRLGPFDETIRYKKIVIIDNSKD